MVMDNIIQIFNNIFVKSNYDFLPRFMNNVLSFEEIILENDYHYIRK